MSDNAIIFIAAYFWACVTIFGAILAIRGWVDRYPVAKANDKKMIDIFNKIARGGN